MAGQGIRYVLGAEEQCSQVVLWGILHKLVLLFTSVNKLSFEIIDQVNAGNAQWSIYLYCL